MPTTTLDYTPNYASIIRERKKKDAEKRKKHAEVVRRWRAGEISWNEYCRQEKKYRT